MRAARASKAAKCGNPAHRSYNAAGRITAITQKLWAEREDKSLYELPLAWSIGYDSRNRLVNFQRSGASTQYSYDANSNRLTAIQRTTADTDLDGEFDEADLSKETSQQLNVEASSNRLLGLTQTLSRTKNGQTKVTSTATVNYSIDANGSMTSDGLRNFDYDESGRLAKVRILKDGEAAKIDYLVNGLGQRVFKGEPTAEQTLPNQATLGEDFITWLKKQFSWMFTQAAANTSVGTAYVYGDGELPAWAMLGEYDNGSATGKGRTEYIWLPTEDGSAIPVAMYRNGNLFAIHTDHLGTPRLVTNEAKKPVWQWPYSAFGDNKPTGILKATKNPQQAVTPNQPPMLKATAATEMNLRFPGQYFDQETGTAQNYFWDYYPAQGRYRQSDPIELRGGLNRFIYVHGRPLWNVDPRGLAVKCKTVLNLLVVAVEECTEDRTEPSEQDARDAKRMSDKELKKACKANGYEDAHALKRDLGLDSNRISLLIRMCIPVRVKELGFHSTCI